MAGVAVAASAAVAVLVAAGLVVAVGWLARVADTAVGCLAPVVAWHVQVVAMVAVAWHVRVVAMVVALGHRLAVRHRSTVREVLAGAPVSNPPRGVLARERRVARGYSLARGPISAQVRESEHGPPHSLVRVLVLDRDKALAQGRVSVRPRDLPVVLAWVPARGPAFHSSRLGCLDWGKAPQARVCPIKAREFRTEPQRDNNHSRTGKPA